MAEPAQGELAATLPRIERAAGALATASVARMDETLPWFRRAAGRPALLGDAGGAGRRAVPGRVAALRRRHRRQHPGGLGRDLRRGAAGPGPVDQPAADRRADQGDDRRGRGAGAAPGRARARRQALREAVLRFSREVAFAAARVYARAAESRGAWDARLQALLVDALLRGRLPGRARQPGGGAGLGRRAAGGGGGRAGPPAARWRRCCTPSTARPGGSGWR